MIIGSKLQLALWVMGISIHNGESRLRGECTPDFSCCEPIRTPLKGRIKYMWKRYSPWEKIRMLEQILEENRLLRSNGKMVPRKKWDGAPKVADDSIIPR